MSSTKQRNCGLELDIGLLGLFQGLEAKALCMLSAVIILLLFCHQQHDELFSAAVFCYMFCSLFLSLSFSMVRLYY